MSVKGEGGGTPQICNLFFGENFVRKGGGTPLTDKIRKVVFDVLPKTSNIFLLIRHVVNCVQPHPTQPLIATSGIDYDVKVTLLTV